MTRFQTLFNTIISALVPRSLRFEFQLALRHLLSGGWQTFMTIGAVAAGVIIVIFITSLIFGLQTMMSDLLTDSIPHIVVRVEDRLPRAPASLDSASGNPVSNRMELQAPQLKFIDDWEQVAKTIRLQPNVRAVAPVVSGQGFASKGANPTGVSVIGSDPVLQDAVSNVTRDLVSGRYLGLGSDEIVIDKELSEELSVAVGDRIRLTSSSGVSDSFTVVGIYSAGRGAGSVYVSLRTAQSLFELGTSVNVLQIKVYEIYEVEHLASTIMALTPYEASPWTQDFPVFLTNMQMMGASAYLISVFSLIASSFAIASVLIVSVLQKSAQIGILKSIGAKQRQILVVFIFEGLGVAVLGSTLGAVIGTSIVYLISLLKRPVQELGKAPDQLFPVQMIPLAIVLAVVAAIIATVVAAVLPARQAAKLNPVDVMR